MIKTDELFWILDNLNNYVTRSVSLKWINQHWSDKCTVFKCQIYLLLLEKHKRGKYLGSNKVDAWFIDIYEQPMITDWDKKSMKRLKYDSGKL